MNRNLIVGGAALVGIGAILLIMLFASGSTPDVPGAATAGASFFSIDPPSRLWAILIGLTMAVGAGMIGIGMNRWKGQGRSLSGS